jgi:hypothetical protein
MLLYPGQEMDSQFSRKNILYFLKTAKIIGLEIKNPTNITIRGVPLNMDELLVEHCDIPSQLPIGAPLNLDWILDIDEDWSGQGYFELAKIAARGRKLDPDVENLAIRILQISKLNFYDLANNHDGYRKFNQDRTLVSHFIETAQIVTFIHSIYGHSKTKHKRENDFDIQIDPNFEISFDTLYLYSLAHHALKDTREHKYFSDELKRIRTNAANEIAGTASEITKKAIKERAESEIVELKARYDQERPIILDKLMKFLNPPESLFTSMRNAIDYLTGSPFEKFDTKLSKLSSANNIDPRTKAVYYMIELSQIIHNSIQTYDFDFSLQTDPSKIKDMLTKRVKEKRSTYFNVFVLLNETKKVISDPNYTLSERRYINFLRMYLAQTTIDNVSRDKANLGDIDTLDSENQSLIALIKRFSPRLANDATLSFGYISDAIISIEQAALEYERKGSFQKRTKRNESNSRETGSNKYLPLFDDFIGLLTRESDKMKIEEHPYHAGLVSTIEIERNYIGLCAWQGLTMATMGRNYLGSYVGDGRQYLYLPYTL